MKQISTSEPKKTLKLYLSMFVTAVLMLFATSTYAHRVISYTPPCVLTGQTVTVSTIVTATDNTTWYHWQYRVNVPGSAPGPWIFLAGNPTGLPVNNTINGTVFAVSNANRVSGISDFCYDLTIANATTALNNIELRVLMGAGADPEIVTSPVWNGDDQATTEAKSIQIRVKPAAENCFTSCTDNILVLNPPSSSSTPVEDFYGGFESGTLNFAGVNGNGSSVTAQTDYTLWTSGFPSSNYYSVVNHADTMIYLATAFAPHSGRDMLVINQSSDNTSRFWYKTLVAPTSPTQLYYAGPLTFKVWVSKVNGDATPEFALYVNGTDNSNTVSNISTVAVTMTTTAGQPGNNAGDWVQYTLSVVVPPNTFKQLEVGLRGNSTSGSSFAVDDICFVAPQAGIVPLTLTALTATYNNGVTNLSWGTEQESNTGYFVVEHSTDGINFSALANLMAAGYSNHSIAYKFADNKTMAGQNFYRIKAMDKDGSYQYSNIASVYVKLKGLFVTGVYPSPFSDKINISVSSESSSNATVSLFDYTGKKIASQNAAIAKGVTIVSLENLGRLPGGIYMVRVQAGNVTLVQKVVK